MSRLILQQGDKVTYRVNGRKMRGAVADVLPISQDRVPIQRRVTVVWMDRKNVRKIPNNLRADCE
jgi:hypothetical protein